MFIAQRSGSIIITSPEAIKSLMLKYIDLLSSVEQANDILKISTQYLKSATLYQTFQAEAKQMKENEQCADDLKAIIRLWGPKNKGILILDEVDLILNPLKSELNFPIGITSNNSIYIYMSEIKKREGRGGEGEGEERQSKFYY
jgi:hypothetical protein